MMLEKVETNQVYLYYCSSLLLERTGHTAETEPQAMDFLRRQSVQVQKGQGS